MAVFLADWTGDRRSYELDSSSRQLLPPNNPEQVIHTYVPQSPSQTI